jgi:hypothetical protein
MNRPFARFLDAVVTTWERVSTASGVVCQSAVKRADDDSRLTIAIETPQFTATIAAWEQAYCLDITLFERTTGSGAELSAGECTTLEEIQERITLLCEMLTPELL